MVASTTTILKVAEILRRHVDEETFKAIVHDLMEVEGNRSFLETLERLNAVNVVELPVDDESAGT
jgi:hypothetical protein